MKGRKEQRIPAVLPVRVMGKDRNGSTHVVVSHAVDISANGVQIGGLSVDFAPGQLVFISRRGIKCQFQVRWSRRQSDGSYQAGFRCLEPLKNIWTTEFGKPVPDSLESVPLIRCILSSPEKKNDASPRNRREHERIACDLGVELLTLDRQTRTWARCSDLSISGCYILTRSPAIAGTKLILELADVPSRPSALAEVRTSDLGLGMGLSFCEMREEDREVLSKYIDTLRSAKKPTHATPQELGEILQAYEACQQFESFVQTNRRAEKSAAQLDHLVYDSVAIAIANIAPSLQMTVTSSEQQASRERLQSAVESVRRLDDLLSKWKKRHPAKPAAAHNISAPAKVVQVPNSPVEVARDRRRSKRITCDIGVELITPDRSARTWARCCDVSTSGCYVQSRSPSVKGTKLVVQFTDIAGRPSALSEVRTCDPGLGMGLHFREMRQEDRQWLTRFIEARSGTPSGNGDQDRSEAPKVESIRPTASEVQEALKVCHKLSSRVKDATQLKPAISTDTPPSEFLKIALDAILPTLREATSGESTVSDSALRSAVESTHRLEQLFNTFADQITPKAQEMTAAVL